VIIDVTYEKADILKLVDEDLRKRRLRAKPGSHLEYKGALQVKLSIDVEEMEEAALPPPPVASRPSTPSPLPEEVEGDEEPSEGPMDMGAILSMSSSLAKKEGKFDLKKGPPRQLGPDETYEYPKDEE
jgi:hypothetical protein